MSPQHKKNTELDAAHTAGDCHTVNDILACIGDKWSVRVIMQLKGRSHRFSELKRSVGGISQRMLTLTLKGLERDGMVTRTVLHTNPPRVDYELTDLGRSLSKPVMEIGKWAISHIADVEDARADFDKRSAASQKRLQMVVGKT